MANMIGAKPSKDQHEKLLRTFAAIILHGDGADVTAQGMAKFDQGRQLLRRALLASGVWRRKHVFGAARGVRERVPRPLPVAAMDEPIPLAVHDPWPEFGPHLGAPVAVGALAGGRLSAAIVESERAAPTAARGCWPRLAPLGRRPMSGICGRAL